MTSTPLWTHLSSLPDSFEDIAIVDLDPSKTTWSRIHEDLRVVYLKLNREPPDLLWTKFFHQERESRTMIRRRGLWIEEGYISFDCLPEEIEPFHLPDIQRSIDFANRKYREYFDMRRREMRASDPVEAARNTLEQMRSRLFQPLDQPTGSAPKPQNATPAPSIDPLEEPAGQPVLLPPEILAAHDAALASAREAARHSGETHSIVKRADQYKPDVVPPPAEVPPSATRVPAAAAETKPAAPATMPAPATNDVTEQSLEQTLADYRAKVRAAFDAQKKKT